ncbi:intercellular adhesion molecule 5-like [Pelodytes ibericus]
MDGKGESHGVQEGVREKLGEKKEKWEQKDMRASLPDPILEMEERITEGDSAEFTCTLLYNGTGEVDLQIKIMNTALESCTQQKKPYPKLICNSDITTDFHGMEITCEAALTLKSQTKTIYIQSEPTFTDCPTEVTWIEGEQKAFHCKASGYPAPAVTCKVGNLTYKEGEEFTITRSMAGKYLCIAKNFDVDKREVKVIVHFKPTNVIVKGPLSLSAREGENVTLTCEADGNPPPTYHWEAPGGEVEYLHDNRTLKIWGMKTTHMGRYNCQAKNKYGTGSQIQDLLMIGYNRGERTEAFWGSVILTVISSYLFICIL